MKAVRFHPHGGADVLCYEDVPDPELAPREVLVRVRACALNHLDLWARRGLPEKLGRARELGASAVLDQHRQGIADAIERLTNRRGVEVVIEHVGEAHRRMEASGQFGKIVLEVP
jgi:NADPH:quinone reductase-like Zn-dependent oxidoreductase